MKYSEIYVRKIGQRCKEREFAINKLPNRSCVHQSIMDNIVCGLTKDPRLSALYKVALPILKYRNGFECFDEIKILYNRWRVTQKGKKYVAVSFCLS